jgi:DNA (cytosine-5)-methyltransferase 1
MSKTVVHPSENRHLTIDEAKRIGSFPDSFCLTGKFDNQWERVGNSVPPLFMRAIAKHVQQTILSHARQTPVLTP